MGSLEFAGKRALVAGGTKGIGQAVTNALRGGGARVLNTARGPSDASGERELFVAADITTADGCAAVADAVLERLGGIDIIVHVVGGSSAPSGGFAALDDAECSSWRPHRLWNQLPSGGSGSWPVPRGM